jgi:uncharacterized membrane protein YuzA (DUF378 family)
MTVVKRFWILRLVARVFKFFGVLSIMLLGPFTIFQIINMLGIRLPAASMLVQILFILPGIFGIFCLYAIGELIDAVLSIEENTRYMADALRRRSKPK